MDEKNYRRLMHIISIVSWVISLMLTCYLSLRVFGTNSIFWIIVGLGVGIVVNTLEILALNKWLRTENAFPLLMTILFGLASISGSIGGLQMSFDKGQTIANISAAYNEQIKQGNRLLKNYDYNAQEARRQAMNKPNWSNHYLKKSDSSLKDAEKLLKGNDKKLTFIIDNMDNVMSLSLYKVYKNLFGGELKYWAFGFNIFLALLLEIGMIFSNYEKYSLLDPNQTKPEPNQFGSEPNQTRAKLSNGSSLIPGSVRAKSEPNQFGFKLEPNPNQTKMAKTSQQIRVTSVDAILKMWDDGEKNKTAIARNIGRTDTWVRSVLKKYGRV